MQKHLIPTKPEPNSSLISMMFSYLQYNSPNLSDEYPREFMTVAGSELETGRMLRCIRLKSNDVSLICLARDAYNVPDVASCVCNIELLLSEKAS